MPDHLEPDEEIYKNKVAQAKEVARANLRAGQWSVGQANKHIVDTIAQMQEAQQVLIH